MTCQDHSLLFHIFYSIAHTFVTLFLNSVSKYCFPPNQDIVIYIFLAGCEVLHKNKGDMRMPVGKQKLGHSFNLPEFEFIPQPIYMHVYQQKLVGLLAGGI